MEVKKYDRYSCNGEIFEAIGRGVDPKTPMFKIIMSRGTYFRL